MPTPDHLPRFVPELPQVQPPVLHVPPSGSRFGVNVAARAAVRSSNGFSVPSSKISCHPLSARILVKNQRLHRARRHRGCGAVNHPQKADCLPGTAGFRGSPAAGASYLGRAESQRMPLNSLPSLATKCGQLDPAVEEA